ncbi:MAG: FtsX-like permease family protein [Vicinamibacteria bacterium]|nr:FtsX-like permease family protein [Vicinamibacteria bacterium]
MRLLLTLAARNLIRRRRRTLLTASALGFGVAILCLSRAWTAAMATAVVEPAKDGTIGHLQVYRTDAADDEGGEISFVQPHNGYRLIAGPRALVARLLADEPRLAAGLARLSIGALLSAGDESMEVLLLGVDPATRAAVYPAVGVIEGRHFAPGENGLLVNRGVARRLGLKPGDDVVALANAVDGRLTGAKLKVTGTWTVRGLEAYEWGACFVDLAAVQELLDAPDQASVLILRQRDARADAAPVARALNDRFRREGSKLRAFTWEEMGGPFIGGMLVTRFISGILDLVMVVIVAAGVTNTALMSVFERTREIGTVRAMGARRGRVLALFLVEALLLSLLGAAIGTGLGAGLIATFGRVGIPAFSEAQRYSYGGDALYPVLDLPGLFSVAGLMIVICVLAALGPALMAARLRPAEALRHV